MNGKAKKSMKLTSDELEIENDGTKFGNVLRYILFRIVASYNVFQIDFRSVEIAFVDMKSRIVFEKGFIKYLSPLENASHGLQHHRLLF